MPDDRGTPGQQRAGQNILGRTGRLSSSRRHEEALFAVSLIQEGKMITSGAFLSLMKSKVELIAGQMVSFGVLVASWATSYSTAKLINLELAIVTLY